MHGCNKFWHVRVAFAIKLDSKESQFTLHTLVYVDALIECAYAAKNAGP